jgi:arabinogalactan endo-1,4-beta-galactosidase
MRRRSGRLSFGLLAYLIFTTTLQAQAHSGDYAFGADLSFLRQAEQQGKKFKDSGTIKLGLQIFRDNG